MPSVLASMKSSISTITFACVLQGLIYAAPSNAQTVDDLYELSLTELLKLKVFSASRKQESIADTASAINVIRRDDIAKSPAKNVAELLRTLPGINVAQVSASEWSISVRGSASLFSPHLLVLVDGRSIYDLSLAV